MCGWPRAHATRQSRTPPGARHENLHLVSGAKSDAVSAPGNKRGLVVALALVGVLLAIPMGIFIYPWLIYFFK